LRARIGRYAKLEKTENWDAKLLERGFSYFAKKIMNEKVICQTVEDALNSKLRTYLDDHLN